MFVQVIQGKARDPEALKQRHDKWVAEVMPGAEGFLGSTAGVTENGDFVLMARFESEDAARRNSDRPEQGRWWSETEQYIEGATFHDCTRVEQWREGGSDDAGFVQVIQAPVPEGGDMVPEDDQLSEVRPDVIGGIVAHHGDGTFTEFVYFTSEEEARAGESKDEFQEVQQQSPMDPSQMTFYDLKDPWLVSP